MVLYHQEWYNGRGYPEGLRGEEIPVGARMVAVIDAWDAMRSDRPYRKALTREAAIAELRRCAGSQFDPKIVDAFLRIEAEEAPLPPAEAEPS
jgi:HD-GYP domain-containing protein (c-di-GMP phosphodiesterase class II)